MSFLLLDVRVSQRFEYLFYRINLQTFLTELHLSENRRYTDPPIKRELRFAAIGIKADESPYEILLT